MATHPRCTNDYFYKLNNYNSQFIQTRNMFSDYLSGYPKHLTYEQWNAADSDDKAALLYIVFYKEVTLAWYNAVISKNVVYVSQDDAVSTVLQYLMKNVDIISKDADRYTPEYIYTVCYRCLLSLWQTRGTDRERCSCEVSAFQETIDAWGFEVSVSLWDLVPAEDDDYETQQTKEAVWNIIRHMGPKAEKVVNHLINPTDTLHKVSGKSKERKNDRLADVSVTPSEYAAIVDELKVKLAPYREALLAV